MVRLLVVLGVTFVGSAALAQQQLPQQQQDRIIPLNIPQSHLAEIGAALGERPYYKVAPIIRNIEAQLDALSRSSPPPAANEPVPPRKVEPQPE